MPMELFNMPLETIYLYGLIGSGILTILYVFFADVVHFDGPDFLNPVIIFAFVTIFSASGYLFEKLSAIHYLLIIGISASYGIYSCYFFKCICSRPIVECRRVTSV